MADESATKSDGASKTRRGRRSKVERVIEQRGLEGLGEELEARWTGTSGERSSLRELAEVFNLRVLRSAVESADVQALDGEVDNLYRLLTGDDVSSGARVEAKRRLERDGVDVDQLTDDFVSHQAIYTYLTKYRDVESPSPNPEDRRERGRETIQRLQNRTTSVVENTISSLRNRDEIDVGEFDAFVDVRVTCTECQTNYDAIELIERGGCSCSTPD